MSMWINEWKEFNINSDHNFLLVKYECETGVRTTQEERKEMEDKCRRLVKLQRKR